VSATLVAKHARRPAIAAFRFIHTADIHLDSPLRSLALRNAALAERVRDATRQAFTRTVDLAIEEQVDALLIAGDLYDGDQTSMKTARFIGEAFKRLTDADIRVFIIRGNHDNLARITRELTLPEGVTVFGARAGIELVEREGRPPIAIHGLSFKDAQAPESLLPKYKDPVPDAINIGLMHTSLGGSPGHDVYAPVSPAELHASGFRYWALGHIHRRAVIEGRATIVMPGMPQGRDIGEAGPKSVTLATVGDDGSIGLEERGTSGVVFTSLDVDVSGEADWAGLERRILRATDNAGAAGRETVLRLGLAGVTPLAWRIRRDLDLLRLEIERELGERSGLWIEKLTSGCRADGAGSDTGPLAELERLIRDDVLPADGFRQGADELGDAIARLLPPDLRKQVFGESEDAAAQIIARLAEDGVADVLARLRAGGDPA
jgi:DNA repair protein SbcD/Mre11